MPDDGNDDELPRIRVDAARFRLRKVDTSRRLAIARWLTRLLVLTLGLLDLAIFGGLLINVPPPTHWIVAVTVGTVFGQSLLVSAGFVWARFNMMVRVLGGGLWLAGLAQLGAAADPPASKAVWFGGLLFYVMLIGVPHAATRAWGYTLDLASGDQTDEGGAFAERAAATSRLHARQFSIWELLTLMTSVAILIVVMRYADLSSARLHMEKLAATFAVLAGTSIVAWWAVLYPSYESPMDVVLGAVGLLIVGLLGGAVMQASRGAGEGIAAVLTSLTNVGTVAAAASVLHVAGFRLARWPRSVQPTAGSTASPP
jgi:hypothetical protein